jgi:hypothetical protein
MQRYNWYRLITGLYFGDNEGRLTLIECLFEVLRRCVPIALDNAFTTRCARNASKRCRCAGVTGLVAGRSVTAIVNDHGKEVIGASVADGR